jgi:hypothetical protein
MNFEKSDSTCTLNSKKRWLLANFDGVFQANKGNDNFSASFQFRHSTTPTATFEFLDALFLKRLPIINNNGHYR